MNLGYTAKILKRVQAAADGTVFIGADFSDIADPDTVRRTLNRLVQSGVIRRVIGGVYEKPKYSRFLGMCVAVDPDAVAKALARNFHWTITPGGDTALNLLGLSTQVPASWVYFSDGPYRSFTWNGVKLEFRHRTNRELTGFSPMTGLVVHALKGIGRKNINPEIIRALSLKISESDKDKMLFEARESTDWIYNIIRKICS